MYHLIMRKIKIINRVLFLSNTWNFCLQFDATLNSHQGNFGVVHKFIQFEITETLKNNGNSTFCSVVFCEFRSFLANKTTPTMKSSHVQNANWQKHTYSQGYIWQRYKPDHPRRGCNLAQKLMPKPWKSNRRFEIVKIIEPNPWVWVLVFYYLVWL